MEDETKRKISNSLKGRTFSKEHREKLSKGSRWKFGMNGSLCNSWKGGTTKLDKLIRERLEYKQWVSSCMTRDDWTCQTCREKGIELQVHHKKPLSLIIKENNITNIGQALNCIELWNIHNGVSLCLECHKQTETYCGKIFKKFERRERWK